MTDRLDDETILSRFGQWLRDARLEADDLARNGQASTAAAAEVPEVGLDRLVEEFTALRHEVKLQTKSSRGLQDQAEALLPALRQAIEQFRGVAPREDQAAQAASRPLAEALADLDEALDRGLVEIERGRRRIVEDVEVSTRAAFDALLARQPWLKRRYYRSYHRQAFAVVEEQVVGPSRARFDALREGYSLIQARLARALKSEKIERIACLHQPVDPALMNVVEVVDDPSVPPGQVIDEVRRGYTWRGRVLRYAEVRASRMAAEDVESDESAADTEDDLPGEWDETEGNS